MTDQLGSWTEPAYAASWAADDVIADLLDLPRRLSVALVADAGIEVAHVVDLGSGPGAYLVPFLRAFPQSRATWLDVSEAMRELAREQLAEFGDRVTYVVADAERLSETPVEPAQVVLSSRALHHFSPHSIRSVYGAVFELLEPTGFVFNLDHVGALGDWEQVVRRVRGQFTGTRSQPLKPHRHDYPLPRTEQHVAWLEEAGFGPPDIPWRMFFTALIVARKPDRAHG